MKIHRHEDDDGDWIDVGTYESLEQAQDRALVALAIGEPIRVENGEEANEFDLQTDPDAAERVRHELNEYEAETAHDILPKVLPQNWAKHPVGVAYILTWVATLLYVFYRQSLDPSLTHRFVSSNILLIEEKEWWRPFTALFLHGDGSHIFGNLISGTVFGALVAKSIGPVKGWALILLSGTLGNTITSFVTYPESFVSLGASTAVFGALGILSGIGIIENMREEVRMPWVRVIAPLLAGTILLGWLGGASVGGNTDVFGHVFGFCVGIGLGAAVRYFQRGNSAELPEAFTRTI